MRENQTIHLVYDGQCPLCCQLAQWVERRSEGRVTTMPDENAPTSIVVMIGDERRTDVAAWAALLEYHPDFSALHWLAAKMGLATEAARVMMAASGAARRLCASCPAYVTKLRRRAQKKET